MTAKTATDPKPKTEDEASTPEADELEGVDEVNEILRTGTPMEIAGVQVEVKRIRTREFLKLTRILTVGFGGGLTEFDWSDDEAELQGQLMAAFINAMPLAENEVIHFLFAMLDTEGLTKKQLVTVRDEMENPEPETALALIEQIMENEIQEFARLGKQMVAWWGATKPKL